MQKTNILLALAGAAVLMASSPALAQAPAAPAAEAPAAAAPAADAAAPTAPAAEATSAEDPTTVAEAAGGGHGGSLTPISMFMIAHPVVQVVMVGLLLASIFSWTVLIIKLIEFGGVNSKTDRFLENFRQARTIADMRKVATADEFDGNPLADMASPASRFPASIAKRRSVAPRPPSTPSSRVSPVACRAVSSSWRPPVRRVRSSACSVPCTAS
jgi:biopolymer transport protein ExbB